MSNDRQRLTAHADRPVLPYALHAAVWLALGTAAWGLQGVAGDPLTFSSLLNLWRWVGVGALSSAPVLYGLRTQRPWRGRPALVPIIVAGGALLAAILWVVLHMVVSHGSVTSVFALPASTFMRPLGPHVLLMLLWCAATTLVLSARDGEQARRLSVEAQHRLLVGQVNPHFLFNALNSVRALVDENPSGARTMITQLSGFLRASLSLQPAHRIRFADEMAMYESYMAIEQVRFEERLTVHLDVSSEAREASVPPLLLAPLVENAVTHGTGTPLIITIVARVHGGDLEVDVGSSGPWRGNVASAGTGLGLSNVRERLRLAFGDHATLSVQHDVDVVRVTLRLPFVRFQA